MKTIANNLISTIQIFADGQYQLKVPGQHFQVMCLCCISMHTILCTNGLVYLLLLLLNQPFVIESIFLHRCFKQETILSLPLLLKAYFSILVLPTKDFSYLKPIGWSVFLLVLLNY